MCTLTYFPKEDTGYFLTSNRDENVVRKTVLEPAVYEHGLVHVLYPKDTSSGGTWIAISNNGFALCLLNGAFVKHVSKPPYLKSRGLVLLDFFDFNDANIFVKMYDFKGIEPFTLVVISDLGLITEVRWDGEKISQQNLDPSLAHIWSSATLYDLNLRMKREEIYSAFSKNIDEVNVEKLLQFHHFTDENGVQPSIKLSRNLNNVQTLSVSCIESNPFQFDFYHEDILAKKTIVKQLAKIIR